MLGQPMTEAETAMPREGSAALPAGVAEGAPDALVVMDASFEVGWANQAAERLFGWRSSDWVGASALSLVHPDDLEMAAVSMTSVAGKVVGSPIEVRVATAGGWRLVELVGSWIPGPRRPADEPSDGGTDDRALVLSLRDLTERRRWEVAANREDLFRTLVHNAAALTLLVRPDGVVDSASGAMTRLLGHDPELVCGHPFSDLVDPADRSRVAASMGRLRAGGGAPAGRLTVEVRLVHRNGSTVPFELTLVDLVADPTVGGFVVTGHDITRLQAAQQALEHLALHDQLTGLPNRWSLTQRLSQLLHAPRSPDRLLVVVFIDLERFKPVNDLFGHDAGDRVLTEVAGRLHAMAGPDDLVARHGGDEFVIVTEVHPTDLDGLRERVQDVIAEPLHLAAGPVAVQASVGLGIARPDCTPERLLAEADADMFVQKRTRRGGYVVVIPVERRRMLAEDLPGAAARGELVVHYQPIVDLIGAETTGVEALVRWQHPRLGLLQPAEFLPIAEDLGRGREVDEFVLRTAVAEAAARARTGRPLTVSVNASSSHLTLPDFPGLVAAVLADTGLDPGLLWVEVTEHAVLERAASGPAASVLETFQRLSDLGVGVAVDDFGTGYSSLSHLLELPVRVLKIDRSFVAGVDTDRRSRAMVEALVALTTRMGLVAVAEGIERPAQLEVLRELGCRHGQGYLLGRPVPTWPAVRGPLGLVEAGGGIRRKTAG